LRREPVAPRNEVQSTARKFGVPVFDYAIAIDHIHFVTKVPSREAYNKFIRALCSLLAKKFG
jgi:REP element-mobilizing transposase RayT